MPAPPLGFSVNPIVRHSAERDADALARALDDPRAQVVLLCGDAPVLRREGAGASALHRAGDLADVDPVERVLLGTLGDAPVLGALAPAEALGRIAAAPGRFSLDLRSLAVQGVLPEAELGLLAQAKALLSWHATHRFCARCSAPTALSASGYRRDCAGCGAHHFPRTDPVAIMLVRRGERCLLGRQARFPTGTYSCLAGFVEPGETVEDAVRRETFEEAGVRVGAVSYALSQPWPFPSSLMIGCVAEALDDALRIDRDELEDARWFDRSEAALMIEGTHPDGLRTPPPVAVAHHLIRLFISGE